MAGWLRCGQIPSASTYHDSISTLGAAILAGAFSSAWIIFADCGQPSPADFGKPIADDTEKWAKVIRGANISRSDRRINTRNIPFWNQSTRIRWRPSLGEPGYETAAPVPASPFRHRAAIRRIREWDSLHLQCSKMVIVRGIWST
jgi:hypothetical protein